MANSTIDKCRLRNYIRDFCINCHKLDKDYDVYKGGHISHMIRSITDILGENLVKDAKLKISASPSSITSNLLYPFHYTSKKYKHILFLYTVIYQIQKLCSTQDESSLKYIGTKELETIYFYNYNFQIGDDLSRDKYCYEDGIKKRINKDERFELEKGVFSNTTEYLNLLCKNKNKQTGRIYEYIKIAQKYGFLKQIDVQQKTSLKGDGGTIFICTQVTTSKIRNIIEEIGNFNAFIHFLRVLSFTEPLGFIGERILSYFSAFIGKNNMPAHIFRQKNIFMTQTLDDDVLAELLEAMHNGYVVEFEQYEIEAFQQRSSAYPCKAIPIFVTVSTRTGKRYAVFLDFETTDENDRIFYVRLDHIKTAAMIEKNADSFMQFSDLDFFQQQNILSLQDWKKYRSNLINQKKSYGSRVSNIENKHEVKITLKLKKEDSKKVGAINEYIYVPQRLKREFASELEFLYEVPEEQYEEDLPYTHIIRISITDADELQSWLKTYTGRIVNIECDMHGFGNTVLKERYMADIIKLCQMYDVPVDINNFRDIWKNSNNISIGNSSNRTQQFNNPFWKERKGYYWKIDNETFSQEYFVFITLICTKCKNMTLMQLKSYLKEYEDLYHFNTSNIITTLHKEGALIYSYDKEQIYQYIDPQYQMMFNQLIDEYITDVSNYGETKEVKYIAEDFLKTKIIGCTSKQNQLFKFASPDETIREDFVPNKDAFEDFTQNFTDENRIIVNHPFCENFESIPLTEYDRRWLLSALNHPRSSMFIEPEIIGKLKGILEKEETEPLYNAEDFYYYDRDKYGECDTEYLTKTSCGNSNLLDKIRDFYDDLMYQAVLLLTDGVEYPSVDGLMEITYDSYANNSGVSKALIYPVKLEYDLHNDNTRIFGIKLEEVILDSKCVYKPIFWQIVVKSIVEIKTSLKAKDLIVTPDAKHPLMTEDGYNEFRKIYTCINDDIIEPAMIMLKVDERGSYRSTLERFTLGISSYRCWNAKSPFEKDVQYLVIIFTWNDWLQIVNKILNSGCNVEVVDFGIIYQKFKSLDKKHDGNQFKDEYKAFKTMLEKSIEIIKEYYPDEEPLEHIQNNTSKIRDFIIEKLRRQIECMER